MFLGLTNRPRGFLQSTVRKVPKLCTPELGHQRLASEGSRKKSKGIIGAIDQLCPDLVGVGHLGKQRELWYTSCWASVSCHPECPEPGIAGYRADNVSAPEYSPAFDLLDPQAGGTNTWSCVLPTDFQVQLWMLQACTSARNDSSLLVRPEACRTCCLVRGTDAEPLAMGQVPCWIEAWRSFVVAVGGSFPVAPRRVR